MTSTRRISFSTNGWTKLVGSRSSVMKPIRPLSLLVASAIFSLAASVPAAAPETSNPEPGCTRLPAISPIASATTVATRK